MAVLGFHLVATMIGALVLQKTLRYLPLTKYLLCGLMWWVAPTEAYLTEFFSLQAGQPSGESKKKRRFPAENKKSGDVSSSERKMMMPRDAVWPLISGNITPLHLPHLVYFNDIHWLLHLSAMTGLIFISSEIFQAIFPVEWKSDLNLTMLWMCLVIYSCLKLLTKLTVQFFGPPLQTSIAGSDERVICVIIAAFFFLLAVVTMLLDGPWLDLGVDKGLQQVLDRLSDLIGSGSQKSLPTVMVLKAVLCTSSCSLALINVFPAMRLARCHLAAISSSTTSTTEKAATQLCFFAPLLLVLLWVPQLSKDLLLPPKEEPVVSWLTSPAYEHFRLLAVVLYCVLRVCLLRRQLQHYLCSAEERVFRLRRRSQRITCSEFQSVVQSTARMVTVIAVQLVSPVLLLLCFTMLLHSFGLYSWTGEFLEDAHPAESSSFALFLTKLRSSIPSQFFTSLLTFYCWWTLLITFLISSFCLVYIRQVDR